MFKAVYCLIHMDSFYNTLWPFCIVKVLDAWTSSQVSFKTASLNRRSHGFDDNHFWVNKPFKSIPHAFSPPELLLEMQKKVHRLSHETAVRSTSPVYIRYAGSWTPERRDESATWKEAELAQVERQSNISWAVIAAWPEDRRGKDPCGSKCALGVSSAAASRPHLSRATEAACHGEEEHCRCSLTHPKPERHLSPALMRMEQCPRGAVTYLSTRRRRLLSRSASGDLIRLFFHRLRAGITSSLGKNVNKRVCHLAPSHFAFSRKKNCIARLN